jgi:hypothetical protein
MDMRCRSFVIRMCVISTGTFIGLLICEAIVRSFVPQAVAVPWQDQINGITVSRPNVQGRHAIPHTFDVTVSINPQRFRGRTHTRVNSETGTIRIAVLGDSFTFGWGANDDETYPAQLERILLYHLNERASGTTVEVINAGNGGNGTGEQVLLFETWVKQFHPKLIVLTVNSTDVDDDRAKQSFLLDRDGKAKPRPITDLRAADENLRFFRRAINSVPGYGFIVQHSQLMSLVRNAFSQILARTRHMPPIERETPQLKSVQERSGKKICR